VAASICLIDRGWRQTAQNLGQCCVGLCDVAGVCGYKIHAL
jgi:hypothetical protein